MVMLLSCNHRLYLSKCEFRALRSEVSRKVEQQICSRGAPIQGFEKRFSVALLPSRSSRSQEQKVHGIWQGSRAQ